MTETKQARDIVKGDVIVRETLTPDKPLLQEVARVYVEKGRTRIYFSGHCRFIDVCSFDDIEIVI